MTTKNNYWTRDEDIDADFAAVSDLYDNSVKYKFKPSAQQRKARSKPSLFIDDSPEGENIFVPRGRGAAFLDSNFKLPVGGIPAFLQKRRQEEITNDIRETSEFRFSSDDIIKSLDQQTVTDTRLGSSLSNKSSDSGHVSSESATNGSCPPSPKKISDEKPPPLYEILKAGRNVHKTKIKSNMNKTIFKQSENIVPVGIFQAVTDKTFDIHSNQDFPELH